MRASDKSGLRPIVLGAGDHQYECEHDWGGLPAHIRYGNTHGVCEDSRGRIYIKHTVHATSDSDDAIVVFNPDGKFISSWGAEFKGGANGLHLSEEGAEDFLYLCDPNRHLVVKTTLDGKDVWRLGVPEASGLYPEPGRVPPDQYRRHVTNRGLLCRRRLRQELDPPLQQEGRVPPLLRRSGQPTRAGLVPARADGRHPPRPARADH